jgi:hypothetical protein
VEKVQIMASEETSEILLLKDRLQELNEVKFNPPSVPLILFFLFMSRCMILSNRNLKIQQDYLRSGLKSSNQLIKKYW